jgi:RHS repeat-associated protein
VERRPGQASQRPGPEGGRPGREEEPELPRFGYRGELALGPRIYLRARTYDTRLGRFTTPDPLDFSPRQAPATSTYAYASNNPLNNRDPLGLFSLGSVFSDVVHAASHVVKSIRHTVHAVAGTVTHGADILAGAVAHAYETAHTILASVAEAARKDAGRIVTVIRDAATRTVKAVGDAVARSAGVVESSVNDAVTWIKKHNQIIGKIGTFLSNVSGDLALAGLIIAPIPGLDFLTPVLETAAVATGIGALATESVAKAAGDRNITYGDLFNAAIGAIPGGGDAEDLERGITTASHISEDAEDARFAVDATGTATDLKGPTSQIQINKAAGDAWRDTVAGFLRSRGRAVVTDAEDRAALTFETPDGPRILDMGVSDKDGNVLGYVETKWRSSPYDSAQAAKDEWLRATYGIQIDIVYGR